MKNRIILTIAILVLLLAGCSSSSPIFGTWIDNSGNSLVLESDGTFTTSLTDSNDKVVAKTGSYTVRNNVMVFQTEQGDTIVTEWDIRGCILYISWTDSAKVTQMLTLYKNK